MSAQDVLNRLDENDRQRLEQATRTSIETGVPYDIEYRILLPDGGTRNVRSRATAIADARGRVSRLLGVTMERP